MEKNIYINLLYKLTVKSSSFITFIINDTWKKKYINFLYKLTVKSSPFITFIINDKWKDLYFILSLIFEMIKNFSKCIYIINRMKHFMIKPQ
jgi:hypothetical protein